MFGVGNAKMGFYPTQDQILPQITNLIDTEALKGTIPVYDNSCGTGDVLRFFKQALSGKNRKVVTYGIELDEERAKQAEEGNDMVLNGSFEDMEATYKFASIGFCNPPYNGQEDLFIRNTLAHTNDNGVVILILKKDKYNRKQESLLRNYMYGVEMLDYPEELAEQFNQFIIIGYKRPDNASEFIPGVQTYLEASPDCATQLSSDQAAAIWYRPRHSRTPRSFSVEALDLEAAAKAFPVNVMPGGITRMQDLRKGQELVPPMNLTVSSLILLMCDGTMSGVIEDSGRRLLISGGSRKEAIKSVEQTESATITKIRYIHMPIIFTVDQSGNRQTIEN